MKTRNETSLPKWAQERLRQLQDELRRTREASAVVHNREWFTLNGPTEGEPLEKEVRLFVLSENSAHPVCSLYKGDVLLVGRSMDRVPWKKDA